MYKNTKSEITFVRNTEQKTVNKLYFNLLQKHLTLVEDNGNQIRKYGWCSERKSVEIFKHVQKNKFKALT